ncbi:MAG: hypothetical protein H6873_06125 [Hyphomicrobiaceae bacterium]|nr:hypothetical protein [Hyphomicrobiaceae bacterium]
MSLRFSLACAAIAAGSAFVALPPAIAQESETAKVVAHFADLALATYQDAVSSAETLKDDVSNLLREPTQDNFDKVHESWQTARIVYKQAELFRYASAQMADLSHRVDAHPIDEGFLDYVGPGYQPSSGNSYANFDLVAQPEITLDGVTYSWDDMSADFIRDKLNFAGGNQHNVAAGFAAIEFMLWGEDNGEGEYGEGNRPLSDFDIANCPDTACNHRGTYLLSAIELLAADLSNMANKWDVTGSARAAFIEDPDKALNRILSAVGSVADVELVQNNFEQGLNGNDPQNELDTFADYGYASHLLAARGILNTYLGDYYTLDGESIIGPSLADLVSAKDSELDNQFRLAISVTSVRMRALIRFVRDDMPLDDIYASKDPDGVARIDEVIAALRNEADLAGKIADALGVGPVTFGPPPTAG